MEVWCLLIDHEKKAAFGNAFSVIVGLDACIQDLKKKVKEERPVVLGNVHAAMLTVWRCMDSEIDFADMDPDTVNDRLNEVFSPDEQKVKKLKPKQELRQLTEKTLLIEVDKPSHPHVAMGSWNFAKAGWKLETDGERGKFLAYWQNKEFPEHERILPLAFDEENRLENHLVQSQGRILVVEHYRHLRNRIISIENLGLDQGVLLTGQRGVGKTTWLWFMLIYLLTLKKNVALHTKGRTYLFYHDRVYIASSGPDVTWPPSTAVRDRIWCLIDSDERVGPPPSYLTSKDEGRIFPVHAAPPNPARYYKWFKQRGGVVIGMPLWNEEEIIEGFQLHQSYEKLLGLLKQEPSHTAIEKIQKLMVDKAMDEKSAIRELIKETIKKYGSVPRDVYSAIINEEHHKRMLTDAINALSYEVLLKTLEEIKSLSENQSPSTSELLVIHVEWSSGRDPDTFIPGFRSEHISRMMIEKLGHLTHVQAKRLFREFRWHLESSTLAGWIFEGLAHGVLQGSESDTSLAGPLRMMKLRSEPSDRKHMHFSTLRSRATGEPLHNFIQRRVYTQVDVDKKGFLWPLKNGFSTPFEQRFFVPRPINNPLFDSFFVDLQPNRREGTLTPIVWIFQASISHSHDGSKAGYPLVRSIKRAAAARARKVAQAIRSVSETEDADEGRLRKRRRVVGQAAGRQVGCKVMEVEVRYVLVSPVPEGPSTHSTYSWNMEKEKWVEREVFCQLINVSVSTLW
ncbi:hypothetical protein ACEPAI_1476 [Sanghuangporus weigelae]